MTETTAPSAPTDERLVRVGPLTRLLTRPDIGALLGAIAIFFAFAHFARAVDWLSDPGIAAGRTDHAGQYRIVAVPPALVLIGGLFGVCAGVLRGSSGLLLRFLPPVPDPNGPPA